jgi:hypothetical protein
MGSRTQLAQGELALYPAYPMEPRPDYHCHDCCGRAGRVYCLQQL